MLTDEQIDILSEALMPYFDELEQWVIQDIARRLWNTLTYSGTIENELAAMQRLGYSPAKMRREVMKLLGADKNLKKYIAEQTAEYKREYAKMMEKINREAAKTGADMVYSASDISNVQDREIWNERGKKLRDSDFLHQLNDVFSDRMEGELVNLTKTAGFKSGMSYVDARKAYTHSLNNSVLRLASGVSTLEKEVTSAVHEMAQNGLRSVNYGANRSQHMESAVRTALRTTYSQLSGAVMDKNINRTGETLVYVSQHWGARNKGEGVENHEEWQGKVYKLDDREYPEEEKRIGQKITSLVEATGYDANTSTVVDPKGLHGYNCRHSHYAWFEGISEKPEYKPEPEPKEIDGKVYDYYAMTQKMRSMEREIRSMRKEQIALKELGMDTERQQELKKKISDKMKEYREFCDKCDIPPKYERTRVEKAGTDIKKTQAYKDYEKMEAEVRKLQPKNVNTGDVAKSNNDDTIELTEDERGALLRYKSFDSYMINEALRNVSDISKLTDEQRHFVELLDSALSKMPKYSGNLMRTINFSDMVDAEDRINEYVNNFIKDKKYTVTQYWSMSTEKGYDDNADISIYVQRAENACDIRAFGLNENEVIYKRQSTFKVLEKIKENNKWYILLEEK